MRKYVASVAVATAFLVGGLLGSAANANTFTFSYSGAGVSASGVFTGDLVTGDQFNLTGITGTETDPSGTFGITGLSPYASADNQLFYPSVPHETFGGISFDTSAVDSWNIFFDGSGNALLQASNDPGGFPPGLSIDFTVSETPLPSTWLMLIAGFAGFGFLAYRGTKKNAPAFAAA